MQRLVNAFLNSARAFRVLIRGETAFQQEVALLIASVPIALWLSDDVWWFAILVGSVVALLIVEILNTGLEAACDAISKEFNIDIQLAKDCGSLAVLLSIVLVAGVWGIAVFQFLIAS